MCSSGISLSLTHTRTAEDVSQSRALLDSGSRDATNFGSTPARGCEVNARLPGCDRGSWSWRPSGRRSLRCGAQISTGRIANSVRDISGDPKTMLCRSRIVFQERSTTVGWFAAWRTGAICLGWISLNSSMRRLRCCEHAFCNCLACISR